MYVFKNIFKYMYISCLVTITESLLAWHQMAMCKLSQDIKKLLFIEFTPLFNLLCNINKKY